jgi:hypothetical protein
MAHVAARSAGPPLDPRWRVTVNFHPDHDHDGTPILAALAEDGVFRSQFETGVSNGGLTEEEGERCSWERRLFGAAYDAADPSDRPKYGALNHRGRSVGGSPRFGSAHLRLRPEVVARCTFCYPDSALGPQHFGVAERCDLLARADADPRDALLDYVEAHLHGPLRLAHDVEAVVLDPCYAGSEVETLARRLPVAVEWHRGFRLPVAELRANPGFRGARVVALGLELARDGAMTPAIVGAAARAGDHDRRDLKGLWDHLARFGSEEMALRM